MLPTFLGTLERMLAMNTQHQCNNRSRKRQRTCPLIQFTSVHTINKVNWSQKQHHIHKLRKRWQRTKLSNTDRNYPIIQVILHGGHLSYVQRQSIHRVWNKQPHRPVLHYAIYLHIHFSFFTFSLSQENHAVLHDQFRFCFYEIICS